MRTLTLSEAMTAVAPELGMTATDTRLRTWLNEAQERLLNRPGNPVGSQVRYRICTSESCLTLPRQVRTVEKFAVCNTPGNLRDEWFEFLANGPGLLESDDFPGTMLLDRGVACCHTDPYGDEFYRWGITCNAADAGKTVILKYFDDTGNKVHTSIGGTVEEGEQITLIAPGGVVHPYGYALSTEGGIRRGGLYGVVKQETDYPIRLWEINSIDGAYTGLVTAALFQAQVLREVGYYEPSETHPIYRRYMLPSLSDHEVCESSDDDCDSRSVTCIVRLQHVPAMHNNDILVLGNLPALKDMVRSIRASQMRQFKDAEYLEQRALRELEGELAAYLGDGVRPSVAFESSETWGAGNIDVW